MTHHAITGAYASRLQALKNKYSIIDSRIEEAQKRPYSADFYVTELKKQRLLIAEEIETMHDAQSA